MTDEEWLAIAPGKPDDCSCPKIQPYAPRAYFQDINCTLHRAHKFPSAGLVKVGEKNDR